MFLLERRKRNLLSAGEQGNPAEKSQAMTMHLAFGVSGKDK